VPVPKCFERHGRFPQGCKALSPNKVLLEIPEEALHATIAFRFLNKGGRGFHAERADLGLKVVAQKLGPVMMPQPHAASDTLVESAVLMVRCAPAAFSPAQFAKDGERSKPCAIANEHDSPRRAECSGLPPRPAPGPRYPCRALRRAAMK
jgi:hypothetical protein